MVPVSLHYSFIFEDPILGYLQIVPPGEPISAAVWLAIVFCSRCCSDETRAWIDAILILSNSFYARPAMVRYRVGTKNIVGLGELGLEQAIKRSNA